ncbi:pantoate--beta-alanine ligase [Deinococcus sp.]|uniref:pantoate--beta-alanine ligase n=1 Tax=Deinococcus sp. TaxID=47478 RepID=UPI0025FD4328|nr:pantoate--beta-alanine ligase [Deinococcus sp.]
MTQLVHTPEELRAALGGQPSLGLVPTMGYLHAGHGHLIRTARAENAQVVLSLFVNPLQFGPSEDFAAYPRDIGRDLKLADEFGVDVVFAPEVGTIYPPGFVTRVSVPGVSEGFDGTFRPGHFTGVATVVLKLLNIVRPRRAYFGEKDWQQLSVVRRLVSDLNVEVQIVGVPTVRSALPGEEGLALSSRNSFFTAAQRSRAAVLSRSLRAVQADYAAGETSVRRMLAAGNAVLATEAELKLDYLSLVDSDMNDRGAEDSRMMSAQQASQQASEFRLLIAARLFGVRLIDNMPLIPTEVRMAGAHL